MSAIMSSMLSWIFAVFCCALFTAAICPAFMTEFPPVVGIFSTISMASPGRRLAASTAAARPAYPEPKTSSVEDTSEIRFAYDIKQ
jgi:hypothetical protein